ncbi:MAG TPA: CHAT domain-containing protein, partial [Thermoanaerobaculia bacterium]
QLTVILDSCHSGSGVRGLPGGGTSRVAPRDVRDVKDSYRGPSLEERGALVLSAARDTDRAFEIRTSEEKLQGAFTWAWAHAVRDAPKGEAVIETFHRAAARMTLERPDQVPVLAGNAAARFAPFLGPRQDRAADRVVVGVRSVDANGLIEIRGGWANGLTVGSELRPVTSPPSDARLEVIALNGMSGSTARIRSGDRRSLDAGWLLELVAWAPPRDKPLRVWMPEGGPQVIAFAKALASEATRAGIDWLRDPTADREMKRILRWNGETWESFDASREQTSLRNVHDAREAFESASAGLAIFVQLPASPELSQRIGTPSSIERVADPRDADYILTGRLVEGRLEYAWVRPAVDRRDERQSPLPLRTDWHDAKSGAAVAAALEEDLRRLQRVLLWQTVPTPPNAEFAYRLAIRRARDNALLTDATMVEGERYGFVLRAAPGVGAGIKPRFIYVFMVDSYGKSVLFFPRSATGTVENRFPLPDTAPEEIRLGSRSAVIPEAPFGADTYFLLATEEPLTDPWILEWAGVRTAADERGRTPFERLLLRLLAGDRGVTLPRPASSWSIERVTITSLPTPARGGGAMKRALAAGLALFLFPLSVFAQDAEERMLAAGVALSTGRTREAKAALLEAVDELTERGDVRGAAAAQVLLAIAHQDLGDTTAAHAALTHAAQELRSHGDLFGAWLGVFLLTQLEKSTGRWTAALARHEEALAIIAQARTSSEPFSLETLARMSSALQIPEWALRNQAVHPTIYKRIFLNNLCEPSTRDEYASALIETGQYERAEEELRAAHAGAQIFAGMYEFTFAARYGDLRFRQGRYEEARGHYHKALSGSLRLPLSILPEHSIQIGIHQQLTKLELATGHIDEALHWNDEALQVARGRFGTPMLVLSLLVDRANLFMQSRRFQEAEATYEEALTLAVSTGNRRQHASIETGLGGMHLSRGTYGTAAAHVEKAIEIHRSLDLPETEAMLWITLAGLHILTGTEGTANEALVRARKLATDSRVDAARDVVSMLEQWRGYKRDGTSLHEVHETLDAFKRNPRLQAIDAGGHLERLLRSVAGADEASDSAAAPREDAPLPILSAFRDGIEGRRQFDLGNVALARQLWIRAFESGAPAEVRANSAAAIGLSFWREGNADAAIHWLTESANSIEVTAGDLRADTMLAGFFGTERRAYYDILIELLIRDGQIEKAFDVTEQARARAFLQILGNAKRPAARENDLVNELEKLRDEIVAAERAPASGDPLHELRRRYEALLPRVQAVQPESAALARVQPLRLDEVSRQLPGGTTLISYYVSRFGAHAWIFDTERASHVRLPLDHAQLRRITCWAEALEHTRSARPELMDCGTDPAKPAEAYAALIDPIRGWIRGSKLLIVPHGSLHYVPFAALQDPATARYLVEDYTIAYLPSANALPFLRAKETPLFGRALVLGDPETEDRARLPGAREEAVGVARRFGAAARLGKAAKASLLYSLNGKFDLVHIAAHASYNASTPLFSAVHLTGGDGRSGSLNVRDIEADLDLTGVNLVVLSACRSGVGKRSEGDEIVGLTRALLHAGTPGVISTLWNINDAATPPLVERFYDGLLSGLSAADALRAAQVALLRDERYAEPYSWAAFVLTGDPAGKWQPPAH